MHMYIHICVQMYVWDYTHTYMYFFIRLQLAIFGQRKPFWHKEIIDIYRLHCTKFPVPSFNILCLHIHSGCVCDKQ